MVRNFVLFSSFIFQSVDYVRGGTGVLFFEVMYRFKVEMINCFV